MSAKRSRKARAWVGCSGFSYNHWKDGVFYPPGLSQSRWLEFYSERFSTVELNVTFYRLPESSSFSKWRERTPDGFRFAVKGSKLITHIKGLSGVEELVAQFMERVSALEDKLGPVLWQTPPKFGRDLRRLKSFVKLLSRFPGLHAFEFRHPDWFTDPVYEVLREAGMTAVSADYSKKIPEPPLDFPFIYIRRHGSSPRAYRGSYSEESLKEDAKLIKKALREGREVYVYFNNDLEGHAPRNALTLIKLLGPPARSR